MGKVIEPNFRTTQDIPVAKVLCTAGDWTEVLMIGTDQAGRDRYASSTGDVYRMLWMIERFKAKLIAGEF